ncbi:MAG: SH3 domain-containing protein [Deltaproteobacteria bacterium]|nr:SH3 domain-containing protein [Deltaproteobacteria bacterium]
MRRFMKLSRKTLGLLIIVMMLLLSGGPGWARTLTVSQPNQQIYQEANFASTPLGAVPQGAKVNLIRQEGEWYKVDYQGTIGWLHRQAVPEAAPAKMDLSKMLFGGPVKETGSDEVALAGKGFTPEVEAGFRQKNPGLAYAQVDKVETFGVDQAQLQKFVSEGGLNP